MRVAITIDESIRAALRRIVYKHIGIVPITIVSVVDTTYTVDIDASPTPAEQQAIKNDIETFLEAQGYYATFEVLIPP